MPDDYTANNPDIVITPTETMISFPKTREVTTLTPASITLYLDQADFVTGVPASLSIDEILHIIKTHYEGDHNDSD